ncbi:MAG: low molecular weight protein-tyrosine-phosphatase [Nocardioides sp.]|uniref:low molecular weight protein-tyrosine-phosphatase n=1 Tax=Nocardioides sp. TaxID=35761 RepID=UPI0039E4AD9D
MPDRAGLPAPRDGAPYRISVVCLGNICRSPTAQVVLEQMLVEAGLADRVAVDSSGLGGWHVGKPMDQRAAAVLRAAGYQPDRHRARQVASDWADDYDLVLAMDHSHLRELRGDVAHDDDLAERVRLFRDFDPDQPGGEVPDPYYGGPEGFDDVLTMIERTSAALVTVLHEELGGQGPHR